MIVPLGAHDILNMSYYYSNNDDERERSGLERSVDRSKNDADAKISASAKLERAYILSMGGVLDTEGMMRPPPPMHQEQQDVMLDDHHGAHDHAMDAASLRGEEQILNADEGDFFEGLFDDHYCYEEQSFEQTVQNAYDCSKSMDNCCYEPLPCRSVSSGHLFDDTNDEQPSDIFFTSLQKMEERKPLNVCTSITPPPRHPTSLTVQDAMGMIASSNSCSSIIDNNPRIMLTLTSFPFRIVHASKSLLMDNDDKNTVLGSPLSDVLSSHNNINPLQQPLQLTPSIPTRCHLLNERIVEAKLLPVHSGSAPATLVYYAIILRETSNESR